MRKYNIIPMILLLLVLTACGKHLESASDESQHCITIPSLTLHSGEEYEEFINWRNRANRMVTAEDLKPIGDFDSVIISDSSFYDFSKLFFNLTDSAGETMCIYVNPKSYSWKNVELEVLGEDDVDKTDMRRTKCEKSGKYTYEGLEYVYSRGKLSSISWRDEQFWYCIFKGEYFSEYPRGTDTFISKLLDLSTARETIDSLSIKKDYPFEPPTEDTFRYNKEEISSGKLSDIIKESGHVFEITITERKGLECRCTVNQALKGEAGADEIYVWFFEDSVKAHDVKEGDTLIVAVNETGNTGKIDFHLSSKSSIYDVAEKEVIEKEIKK